MRLSLFVAALLVSVTVVSPAQSPTGFDPATLDPSVMLVISGGRWHTEAQRGTFRLLMLRGDPGPMRSRVVVQWLEEQPATRRLVVHASRDADAIPNGTWSLAAPRLELRDRRWYAVIVGTTDAGRIRRTWRFALDVPGKLREVQLP